MRIRNLWRRKESLDTPAWRFYGGDGTIHRDGAIDVEVHNGEVVSVWYRCQPLPFRTSEVNLERAEAMARMDPGCSITGLVMADHHP